jgi:Spy/CpxP family protein refolding chaperone
MPHGHGKRRASPLRWRSIALAAIITACGGAVAHFDVTPPTPVHDAPAASVSSPEVGVVLMITDAIADLDLNNDQNKQLVALVNDITERHRSVQDKRKRLMIDMASSVEAGAFDEAALALDAEDLGKARADVAAGDAKALEDVHRILTPTQRKRFATSLAARAEKLPTDDARARYSSWRSDLQITTNQNEKIAQKLDADTATAESARAEREAWRKRLLATAADFEREPFTSASYVDADIAKTTIERTRRVIAFMKLVVPELTPKQVKRAAENLRAEAGVSP